MNRELLKIQRIIVAGITGTFFPIKNIGETKGLFDANRHLEVGSGLAIFFTHFSIGDPPRLDTFVLNKIPKAREVRILSPVAEHQYKQLATRAMASFNGTELAPIVTRDTLEKWRKLGISNPISSKTRREMYSKYKELAADTLHEGGIVAVAPQAGRRPRLSDSPEGNPVEQLFSAYVERYGNIGDVGLICVGLGLTGEQNYKEARDLNPGRPYTASAGELLLARDMKDPVTGFAGVDKKVFDNLRKLVPKEYL